MERDISGKKDTKYQGDACSIPHGMMVGPLLTFFFKQD